jgi:hypothetical protein
VEAPVKAKFSSLQQLIDAISAGWNPEPLAPEEERRRIYEHLDWFYARSEEVLDARAPGYKAHLDKLLARADFLERQNPDASIEGVLVKEVH